MPVAYTISGAALQDDNGEDFMVAALPLEYIPDDAARRRWRDHFLRIYKFPVVIAWVDQAKNERTLRGESRLLRLLEARSIDALPWQRIAVESDEPPPISYDHPEQPSPKT